jgi:hypothetical protein
MGKPNGGDPLAGIEVRQKGVRICLIKDRFNEREVMRHGTRT